MHIRQTVRAPGWNPDRERPNRGRTARVHTKWGAAITAVALLTACTSGSGASEPTRLDVPALQGDGGQTDELTDGEVDTSDEVRDDGPRSGGAESLSGQDLLDHLDGLSDEDYDAYVDGLSDEEFDDLVTLLDDRETGTDIERDEADDDDDDAPDASSTPDESATTSASTRDDVDCSADGLGADGTFEFTSAHVVVDGVLGELCFGAPDQRVTDAWADLAVIAPKGQLADIGIFAGFEATESGDEVTLAFVNALDEDGSLFQMSVSLDSYTDDPVEAQLTMAHEFTHVFAALPSQIDRTDEGIDACATYFNGEGCYFDDALLFQWITEFWGDGLIEQVDPNEDATGQSGQARCAADEGFFGAYAASTPEEDFAESFSAYVFAVEPHNDEQRERLDWIGAQPGLAEFRERAVAADIEPPSNNFGECGLG